MLTSNLLWSMVFSDFVSIIQLSLHYSHISDEARMNMHQASYLLNICLIWLSAINMAKFFRVSISSLKSLLDLLNYLNFYLFNCMYYMSRMSFRVNLNVKELVCLYVKELLAWSMRPMWSSSDSSEIRTHNHLVRKGTLNNLVKITWSNKIYLDNKSNTLNVTGRIHISVHYL